MALRWGYLGAGGIAKTIAADFGHAGLKIQGKGYQKSQPGDPYFDLAAGWNTTQGVNAQLRGGYDFNFGNRTDAFTAGPWGGASFQTRMPEGVVSPNASGYAPETRAMLQYGLNIIISGSGKKHTKEYGIFHLANQG